MFERRQSHSISNYRSKVNLQPTNSYKCRAFNMKNFMLLLWVWSLFVCLFFFLLLLLLFLFCFCFLFFCCCCFLFCFCFVFVVVVVVVLALTLCVWQKAKEMDIDTVHQHRWAKGLRKFPLIIYLKGLTTQGQTMRQWKLVLLISFAY